jgi:hypothetical protein
LGFLHLTEKEVAVGKKPVLIRALWCAIHWEYRRIGLIKYSRISPLKEN